MDKRYVIGGVILLFLIGAGVFWAVLRTPTRTSNEYVLPPMPDSPQNATYSIDDQEVTLASGLASTPVAPDSASLLETRMVEEPRMMDINGDSATDAVVVLTQTGGGSGTFYYIAAALADGPNAFQGTNAILLGDRVAIDRIDFTNSVLTVVYREHGEGQAMTEEPAQERSAYLTLSGAKLMRTEVQEGSQVFSGNIIYGHEVSTFTPCGGEAHWIATTSRARAALEAVYETRTRGKEPYTPMFIVVAGTVAEGLTEGFAADFSYSIDISSILTAPEDGSCPASSHVQEPELEAVATTTPLDESL